MDDVFDRGDDVGVDPFDDEEAVCESCGAIVPLSETEPDPTWKDRRICATCADPFDGQIQCDACGRMASCCSTVMVPATGEASVCCRCQGVQACDDCAGEVMS